MEFEVANVEKIKKGEFVRKCGKKKVYRLEGYDRSERKYCLQDWDDFSRQVYVKKGTPLEYDFIF
jgi:hypothetical protein